MVLWTSSAYIAPVLGILRLLNQILLWAMKLYWDQGCWWYSRYCYFLVIWWNPKIYGTIPRWRLLQREEFCFWPSVCFAYLSISYIWFASWMFFYYFCISALYYWTCTNFLISLGQILWVVFDRINSKYCPFAGFTYFVWFR